MVELAIHSRSTLLIPPGDLSSRPPSRFPIRLSFPQSTLTDLTLGQLRSLLSSKKYLNLDPNRIRLSLPREVRESDEKKYVVVDQRHGGAMTPLVDDGKSLDELGVMEGDTLVFKDLGPQIGWRTVFFIEYFGPLWIHPLFYYHVPALAPIQSLIWRLTGANDGNVNFEHSQLQKVIYALVMIHFVKREIETAFIHRFSASTMPFRNVFKNSTHYWGLSGLLLAPFLYSPKLSERALEGSFRAGQGWINFWTIVWTFAELSNLITHLNLASLRPDPIKNPRQRGLPKGYGFNLVSYPNYFFESLAWLAIWVMSGSWAAFIFLTVSFAQMFQWAIKKHKRYQKEFGKEKMKGRRAIIPFVV